MGASASQIQSILGSETIDCHDIRSKRLRNAELFRDEIRHFGATDNIYSGQPASVVSSSGNSCTRFICRKRPINAKERELGDFDVLSRQVIGENVEVLWMHKCGIRLNMEHLYIEHHGYLYNKVFGEESDTEHLFTSEIAAQLEGVQNGQHNCVLAFGATGSGKTYTIHKLTLLCVSRLLDHLTSRSSSSDAPSAMTLSLACLEIKSDTVTDILHTAVRRSEQCSPSASTQPSTAAVGNKYSEADAAAHTSATVVPEVAPEVTLRDDEHGDTVLVGASSVDITSMAVFSELLDQIMQCRVTKATGVHDQSSRSHLVMRFQLSTGGSLHLVDLAGSEWAHDQRAHDKQRIHEACCINASLMVLKKCIHARAAGVVAPHGLFRECKLTRLLKPCLRLSMDSTSKSAELIRECNTVVIVGTVSPCSSNTEHSMTTASNTSFRRNNLANASTEAGINGELFLMSNVKGKAMLNWKSSSDAVTVPSSAAAGAKAISEGGSATVPVCDWSSARVCEWFVDAFATVMGELNNEAQELHGAAEDTESCSNELRKPEERLVTVCLSAKKWVRLRLEGCNDSLGLAFDDNFADFPTVKKVLAKGYVKMLQAKAIMPGFVLRGVRANIEPGTLMEVANVTTKLKYYLKKFKEHVHLYREYDDKRTKFMTKDMEILRNYILNGVAPPPLDSLEVAVGSTFPAENGISMEPTPPKPQNPAPIEPIEPLDMCIWLSFANNSRNETETKELEGATGITTSFQRMPAIPRPFTGESRIGGVWTGKELVEKFYEASDARKRMTVVCNGSETVANKMWALLKEELQKQG